MILLPEVLAIFILDSIFVLFCTISFVNALKIYRKWDADATTNEQYILEKKSYLSATIIKFVFMVKVPLFLFFIFSLDKISDILTGAMCGAGVVDATIYGNYLFVLKILNLYLFAYWLALNHEDLKHEVQPYTKVKFGFFILIYFLLMTEIFLEFMMFSSINLNDVVDCCGSIYSSSASSYFSLILSLKHSIILALFYSNFFLIALFYYKRYAKLFAFANIFFLFISIVSLITFFGTYIYESPSHHCPFCLLQKEYYYVGYLLYTLLFLGTFSGIYAGFLKSDEKTQTKNYKFSLIFNSLYLLIVSAYPLFFYLKNGVLL